MSEVDHMNEIYKNVKQFLYSGIIVQIEEFSCLGMLEGSTDDSPGSCLTGISDPKIGESEIIES